MDCGVIYATDAFSEGLTVVDEATSEMCGQVIYPAAVMKNSQHPDEAKAFLDYLSTDEAMAHFEGVGFSPHCLIRRNSAVIVPPADRWVSPAASSDEVRPDWALPHRDPHSLTGRALPARLYFPPPAFPHGPAADFIFPTRRFPMDWYPLFNSLRIAAISTAAVFFLGILAAYYIARLPGL